MKKRKKEFVAICLMTLAADECHCMAVLMLVGNGNSTNVDSAVRRAMRK
jgi:hypothetical protein